MTTFTGVLAVLHTTTADRRRLDEPHPELTRPMPLPLRALDGAPVGAINSVWRDGDLLRYSGELFDGHPGVEEVRAEIGAGHLVGMLDVWITDDSVTPVPRAYPLDDFIPDDPRVLEMSLQSWRVTSATLLPPPASRP